MSSHRYQTRSRKPKASPIKPIDEPKKKAQRKKQQNVPVEDEYADMPPLIDDTPIQPVHINAEYPFAEEAQPEDWTDWVDVKMTDDVAKEPVEDKDVSIQDNDSEKTEPYVYDLSCTSFDYSKYSVSSTSATGESQTLKEDPNVATIIYANHFYGWSNAQIHSMMYWANIDLLPSVIYEAMRQRIHFMDVGLLLFTAKQRGGNIDECVKRAWDGLNRFYMCDIPDYQQQWFIYWLQYQINQFVHQE